MVLNPRKASVFGAIIMLVMVYTNIVSGQTPAAASLAVKSDLTPETKEAVVEKQAAPPTKGTEMTTGPEQVSEVTPPVTVSNLVSANAEPSVPVYVTASRTAARAKLATPQTTSSDDEWQFQITPYFWLASLHGTAGVGNRTTQVDESFGDIFDSLKFALMGVFEARRGKLVILTDMEYVSIEDEGATPGPFFSNVTAGFKTFIFNPEVGYRVYEDPDKGSSIDVLGGIRVWHVSTELDFGAGILPATRVEGSRNWVDATVGLRGKAALSEKVFVTGKFDLGGGGSKFSWHLFGGGGYNVNSNVALIFGYRVLDVNYDKDNFIYDMNQRGPIMGLGFRF